MHAAVVRKYNGRERFPISNPFFIICIMRLRNKQIRVAYIWYETNAQFNGLSEVIVTIGT